ncbi:LysR family transcriptional regulator [Iodidimonas sp. SYSU 1G8]|uniref:LysR family transcriptional regulator n=1 Tax=Iodidimonas sp. SYSU 1G8 TaxID=3133967 RepID=UPI0031FE5C54
MYNWDDLRYVLELSRRGRLAAAARALQVDHTTVARRVAALEESLNTRLFDRTPRGYVVTKAGQALLSHAERIEAQSIKLYEEVSGQDATLHGTVRMAATEGLAIEFLAKEMVKFRERHPGIVIELVASTPLLDLSRREADLALTLSRPQSGRLIAWKVANYALGLYATRAYLDRMPPIRNKRDLNRHDLIWYVDDLVTLPQLRFLDDFIKDPNIVFESTSVVAHFNAALSGLGMAFLHCFAAEPDPNFVRILPEEVEVRREFWLVVHEDLRHVARVEAVCDFLTQLLHQNQALLMGRT